ncbi:MAG: SusC/RagA family TonB-linked outer membrane protein, partial [Bacteroidetes bacterium]|nr:SusC/RagA family TonB-linked outer membrane protein [Bacteroidota bacterium]
MPNNIKILSPALNRFFLCVLAGMGLSVASFAQTDTLPLTKINGVVRSSRDGTPVAGASVKVKGTAKTTLTNEKGSFVLLAKPGDSLEITSIGFARLVYPCTKATLLNLTLPEDYRQQNEALVIGYGNERKRNITGSISSISAADLEKSSAISFDNAIMGKAAGVQVLSSSGVPGSATGITIRGLSTLSSDGNQPLIVIDGMPVYGSGQNLNTSTFNNSTSPLVGFGGTNVSDNLTPAQKFENNPLSSINPADIESIEILKDAYATAIYGSRGTAGVILITTKKGSKGKPQVNVRYMMGRLEPIGKYKLLSGPEYNSIYTDYYKALGQNTPFTSQYNTDWVKAVTRKPLTQQADVSVAGGGDKTQFFISGSYLDNPSYVIENNYKRYTGRMNISFQPGTSFSAGAGMSMSFTDNTSMNAPAIYRAAITKAPNLPITNSDGSYNYGKGTNPHGATDVNPVADALLNTNSLQTMEETGTAFMQYKPLSWLSLRSELGVELNAGEAYTRRVKRPSGFGNDAVQTSTQNRKVVINNTMSFLRSLPGGHYINAVLGQSFEKSSETTNSIGGYNFFSDNIRSIDAAGNKYIIDALTQKWAIVSYFGRLNYEFRNRYLAGVTYRVDGSSKFGAGRRYVSFPSFSAGWRISREAFLEDYKWIDDIKIRGSLGFTGNNNSSSYYGSQGQYLLNSNNLTYSGTPILQAQQPDNPNLKWERTRAIDIGLDVSFWNGRLTGTFDYYRRRVKDMVLSSAVPLYQGWTVQPQNIGDMMNEGLELMVNATVMRKKNFSWQANFNISTNHNKILRLTANAVEVGLANDAYKFMKVGQSAGQFFLYDWKGVDPMTGNPTWGDGKGGSSDIPPASRFQQVADVNVYRQSYGTSLPDFFGGMGHTLFYKSWQLDAFCSFSIGSKMINGSRATLLTYTTEDANNLDKRILNHWLVPGHATDIPKLVNRSVTVPYGSTSSTSIYDYTTSRTNSRFLENGSYLRLRTVTLAYNLTAAKLQQLTHGAVRSLQVFVRGTNLLTLTGYSGLHPEVNAFGSAAIQSGYDELTMPQS